MKRFIASVCTFMLVFTATTISAATVQDDEPTPIVIHKGSGNDSQITRPRTPAFIPVTGMYDSGRVILDFTDDIGNLNITVANLSTGETYFDYCDSADGHFEMEVSTSEGDYLLTIQTENGTTYYGNFTL